MAGLIFKIGDLVIPDAREKSWEGQIGLYLAKKKTPLIECIIYFPHSKFPHIWDDCIWYDILLDKLEIRR